jgi:hypothetical protein
MEAVAVEQLERRVRDRAAGPFPLAFAQSGGGLLHEPQCEHTADLANLQVLQF